MAISGPTPGRPSTKGGGLNISINDVSQGTWDSINFQDLENFTWTTEDDVLNDRVNIVGNFSGEMRLNEITNVNLAAGGALEDLLINTSSPDIQVTRIIFVGVNIDTVTLQPSIEIGTDNAGNPPNNDYAAAQALSLANTNEVQEISLISPRPLITQTAPFNVLRMRQTVTATATAYIVNILIYGALL